MDEYFQKIIEVNCSCGCGYLVARLDKEDGYIYITHYIDHGLAVQESTWSLLGRRLKMIWYIITGKEYAFYDVVLHGVRAKEFLAQLQEFGKVAEELKKNIKDW